MYTCTLYIYMYTKEIHLRDNSNLSKYRFSNINSFIKNDYVHLSTTTTFLKLFATKSLLSKYIKVLIYIFYFIGVSYESDFILLLLLILYNFGSNGHYLFFFHIFI